jgi:hypothetical protein
MARNAKTPDQPAAVKAPGEHGTAGSEGTASHGGGGAEAGHHAAKAHGRPATVDTSLPASRPELMDLHRAARARRNAAALGSEAFRAAVDEIARIEVRIAALDRAADPPLG